MTFIALKNMITLIATIMSHIHEMQVSKPAGNTLKGFDI